MIQGMGRMGGNDGGIENQGSHQSKGRLRFIINHILVWILHRFQNFSLPIDSSAQKRIKWRKTSKNQDKMRDRYKGGGDMIKRALNSCL